MSLGKVSSRNIDLTGTGRRTWPATTLYFTQGYACILYPSNFNEHLLQFSRCVYNLYIFYFVFVFPSLCILNFNAILEHELNRFFITAAVQFTSQFRDTLHVCFLSAAVAVEDLFLAELITLNVFYSSSFSCRFITTTVISYPLAKFYTFFYHHHE